MFDVRRLLAAFSAPVPPGPLGRGMKLMARGRPADALVAFDEAVALADPATLATAHNKRGVALIALERRDEALAAFAAALEADAAHVPALVNIGNALLESGALEDAIDYYAAAIRTDDEYAPAHRNLGIAYKRAGRREESVRALRTADRCEVRPSRRRA